MFICQTLYITWLVLGYFVCHSGAILRTYNLTVHSDIRAPGMWTLNSKAYLFRTNFYKDGVKREVYLINGQQPGPLIEADEGDDLEIFVKNLLPVDTTLHWHGQ